MREENGQDEGRPNMRLITCNIARVHTVCAYGKGTELSAAGVRQPSRATDSWNLQSVKPFELVSRRTAHMWLSALPNKHSSGLQTHIVDMHVRHISGR